MKIARYDWNESLSIGNKDVDDDHKKLIEIINNLIDLIELNLDRKEFARILSKMTDYSLTHFKREEAYMQKFCFPELSTHQKHHMKYIYKVSIYNDALLSHNPPDPKEIVDFLKAWWENHILKEDSGYEIYKKKLDSPVNYK
jgi:hemerythrin